MIDREIKQHFALFLLSYLYSYDPSTYGKREVISSWGFLAVSKNWNFDVREGQMVEVLVFSQAEEVELVCNGQAVARKESIVQHAVRKCQMLYCLNSHTIWEYSQRSVIKMDRKYRRRFQRRDPSADRIKEIAGFAISCLTKPANFPMMY